MRQPYHIRSRHDLGKLRADSYEDWVVLYDLGGTFNPGAVLTLSDLILYHERKTAYARLAAVYHGVILCNPVTQQIATVNAAGELMCIMDRGWFDARTSDLSD